MCEFLEIIKNNIELIIALCTLLITVIVLIYSIASFNQKKGCKIRYGITTSTSFETKDSYISELQLENLKDKTIAIYNVYLRFGSNIYLDLLKHQQHPNSIEEPIIIPPYTTIIIGLGPQLFYTDGINRIKNIDFYLRRKNQRKTIVLSTNYGKVLVKKSIKRWEPLSDYWKNYYTTLIYPLRVYDKEGTYRDKSYGSDTLFIAKITVNGEKCLYPIFQNNKVQFFSQINFTEEMLTDKNALINELNNAKDKGLIVFDTIEIIDLKPIFSSINEQFVNERNIEAVNWLKYRVFGRIDTLLYEHCKWYERKAQKKDNNQ